MTLEADYCQGAASHGAYLGQERVSSREEKKVVRRLPGNRYERC
jgi:hypothetical protein